MRDWILDVAVPIYNFLVPASWIVLAIVVLLLLPLSIFKKTRAFAGSSISFSSYVFGLTTWVLGVVVTFSTWGWVALLIGLLFFGFGVVPIGILASFIKLKSVSLGFTLIVMSIITYGTRIFGTFLSESVDAGEFE